MHYVDDTALEDLARKHQLSMPSTLEVPTAVCDVSICCRRPCVCVIELTHLLLRPFHLILVYAETPAVLYVQMHLSVDVEDDGCRLGKNDFSW